MLVQINLRFMVLAFAFCQVMGVMCVVPDLSLADDVPQLTGEMSYTACLMDGTLVCPPSLTSSPERHIKISVVADVCALPKFSNGATTPVSPSAQPIRSVSSTYSIVPISIASSSVLRI
ncbi:MAG: hypothetical protein OEY77_05205 [Nitrospira sp.]|nr:hypothetical protein [Nitrospira sp.]